MNRIASRQIFFETDELLHSGQGVFELDKDSELLSQIQKCLLCFRAVVPRINGKAPTDCPWLVPNMECTDAQEVWLMIQSSEILQDEVTTGADILELQQFIQVDPKMEFYCFINHGRLVAISQKNVDIICNYEDEVISDIEKIIVEFCKKMRMASFESSVMHIYIDSSKLVKIIKSKSWDSCGLFSKTDLENIKDEIVFKVATNHNRVALKKRDNSFPYDVKNVDSAVEIVQVLEELKEAGFE
eukprot:NODE_69_length_23719_cov_0.556689.p10 type:complete len:243 gc:universal NODE_69_length_23719_cov_0.556689:11120-10392(-)